MREIIPEHVALSQLCVSRLCFFNTETIKKIGEDRMMA